MPNSKCGYLALVPSRSGVPFPSDATRLRLERPHVAEGREMRAVDKRDKSPRGKLILVTSSRTLRVGRVWRFRKHGVKLPFGIGIPNVVL